VVVATVVLRRDCVKTERDNVERDERTLLRVVGGGSWFERAPSGSCASPLRACSERLDGLRALAALASYRLSTRWMGEESRDYEAGWPTVVRATCTLASS
jgi:hypothetical protein